MMVKRFVELGMGCERGLLQAAHQRSEPLHFKNPRGQQLNAEWNRKPFRRR